MARTCTRLSTVSRASGTNHRATVGDTFLLHKAPWGTTLSARSDPKHRHIPSSSQHILMKEEAYETWEVTWIITWHHLYIFIISSWISINNIELHLYLQLDRRQKSKLDARANTSQREQYGGTVHLFIGTRRGPDRITFMSLITNYNHDTNYQGLSGLFLFKSVLPFVSVMSSCRSSLDYSFGIYLRVVPACIWPCRRCFFLEDLRRRRRPSTGTYKLNDTNWSIIEVLYHL